MNNISNLVVVLTAILSSILCEAQPYIFSKPIRLSRNINSSAEESSPIYDSKNRILYIARAVHRHNVGGRFSGFDIWYSQRKDQNYFTKAKHLKELNNLNNNSVIGLDVVNDGLFLLNSYMHSIDQTEVSGLSYSSKTKKDKFQYPIPIEVNTLQRQVNNKFYSLTMNKNNDVLLISMQGKGSIGQEDLYVSFKFKGHHRLYNDSSMTTGEYWSTPIHLGDTINSYSFETGPVLAPDDKTLFFSSDRKGGKGNSDVYYSIRLDDTWQNWTRPVNMGDSINTRKFEGYLHLTDSGEYFLSSSRTRGLADIYIGTYAVNDSFNIQKKEVIKDLPDSLEMLAISLVAHKLQFDSKSSRLGIEHYETMQYIIGMLKKYNDLRVGIYFYNENGTITDVTRQRETTLASYLSKEGLGDEKMFFIDNIPDQVNGSNDVVLKLHEAR